MVETGTSCARPVMHAIGNGLTVTIYSSDTYAIVYDAVTLDQLRALVAVVEQGSFSAAARKLKRVQSAVSTSMANLEEHLGVPVWDRSTKIATLTPQGHAVLASARRILGEADGLRELTAGMANGLEAAVSLCFDALFPLQPLLELCAAFSREFPSIDLRIDTQVMSAVAERVLSGSATLGVVSPPGVLAGLERQSLATIDMLPLVSPGHALARAKTPVSEKELLEAVQIVLSERSENGVADQAVLSPRTWRIAELHTKHQMLLAGLGWGNLPEHLVRDDLAAKRLVELDLGPGGDAYRSLTLSAVYKKETVLGPAHRWLLKELAASCALKSPTPRPRTRVGKAGKSVIRRASRGPSR
jgi:DNA-binding transcriptional LysR family regulator